MANVQTTGMKELGRPPTQPSKTEPAPKPRVSHKALDSIDRLTKAISEIVKAGKTPEEQVGRPLPTAPVKLSRQQRGKQLSEKARTTLAAVKRAKMSRRPPPGPGGETNQ
jgi:hypothetical protein